jgi:hypothetical protein
VIAVARDQDDGVAADGEFAFLLDTAALGVAEVVEPIDELLLAEGLPAIQLQRPRIDPRQHALAFPVQALVDALARRSPSSS